MSRSKIWRGLLAAESLVSMGLWVVTVAPIWAMTAEPQMFDVPRLDGIQIDGQSADWGDRGLRVDALKPFEVTQTSGKFDVRVSVEGGGPTGQAGAVRLGIARALVSISEEHKSPLRAAGMVTRDPRMVERKKYGQRKARKRFQFSKR
jgi:small subunit ribosomal protein S9